ncbi:MAG: alpha/beta fold hydrolase [Betaproteobacteria bacterium]|nr:alpha/beta fold hydrolase [Betaproteobacteria bacterium]
MPGVTARAADKLATIPPYRAPWWLPGGNAQTLYAALFADAGAVPDYRRTRWDTPDGDFVDIDWRDAGADSPLVVLFHGLEGDSSSHNARVLVHAFRRAGWRVAVAHFRGCSGEPNRLARAYHSGDSPEIAWMLERFAADARHRPVAVGISLGGNALLKYLGEAGSGAKKLIRAAVSVSAPLDLMVSGEVLGRGFARIYSAEFLRTLKRKSAEKASRFPGVFDAALMRRARTLREFDNVVTAPLHGYRDTDDYWTRASAKPLLRSIEVPTLLMNARNDPFLPGSALPLRHEVSRHVECEFPEAGGHVGFVTGAFPGSFEWFANRIIGFVDRHAR